MTDRFDKFMEWSYLDDNCRRRIVEDAPEYIKEEAKKSQRRILPKNWQICVAY